MIKRIRIGLRCTFGRHAWTRWSTWRPADAGAFVHTRYCVHCGKDDQEQDG